MKTRILQIRLFTLVLFLLIQVAIFSQSRNSTIVKNLNLAESFSFRQTFPLSRFVSKIIYVPLETNAEDLIPESADYELTVDYIIVRTKTPPNYRILLFDRNTGKFLREIGKKGRGPTEFAVISAAPFNSVKKEIYAFSFAKELLTYDITGKNTGVTKLQGINPSYNNGDLIRYNCDYMLNEDVFISYILNFRGDEKSKLVLYTKDKVLKVFPNYLTFDGQGRQGPVQFRKIFYKWNNKTYFLEGFVDTLYEVTKELLIPRYFFDWGNYNAPYSRMNVVDLNNYYFLTDLGENNSYIFFRIWFQKQTYTGFIEKANDRVSFCRVEPSGISGLKDDVTGLMDVIPKNFTQKNEMIYIIQPSDLLKWFIVNPEKATATRYKFPWLKDMNELSNPIIAIAKCKE